MNDRLFPCQLTATSPSHVDMGCITGAEGSVN